MHSYCAEQKRITRAMCFVSGQAREWWYSMAAAMKSLPFSDGTRLDTSFALASTSVDSLSDQSDSTRAETACMMSLASNQFDDSGSVVSLEDVFEILLPLVRW